jgi:predicted amidophosphoribosyltransferase
MTETLPSKWCPQCRDEFLHAVQRCPECDVALVDELGEALAGADTPGWLGDWRGDLDQKAEEAQRQRSEWSEAESCPACQTPMEAEAAECSECGLVFVVEEEP